MGKDMEKKNFIKFQGKLVFVGSGKVAYQSAINLLQKLASNLVFKKIFEREEEFKLVKTYSPRS